MRYTTCLLVIFAIILACADTPALPIRDDHVTLAPFAPFTQVNPTDSRIASELTDAKEAFLRHEYDLVLMHTGTIRCLAVKNRFPLPQGFEQFEKIAAYAKLSEMLDDAEESLRLKTFKDASLALEKAMDFASAMQLILPMDAYVLFEKIMSDAPPAVYNFKKPRPPIVLIA